MNKKLIAFQIVIICILAAMLFVYLKQRNPLGSTYIVAPVTATSTVGAQDIQSIITSLPLINPAVAVDLGKKYIVNFTPLRADLAALQTKEKNKTYIYFLFLNSAAWLGLNERDLLPAASTIKVPLAMSIYRLAEEGKLNMQDTYKLDQLDLDDNFGTLYKVGADKTFTIQELVGIMLQYSDNTAARALLHVTELVGIKDPFSDVYNAMGWEKVEFGSKPTYININMKTLSNMFISLYNATYLNVTDSEVVLHYLDLSTFDQQIVAGIPAGILVAHKIGIDEVSNTYSDCGIVYQPHYPYILCVGVQGESQVEADAFMKSVSQKVYSYVSQN